MTLTRQSTMREVRDARKAGNFTPEEAHQLFATQFDPTIASLSHTLSHLGMTPEQYAHLLQHVAQYMEACTDINDEEKTGDRTVEEMDAYTQMSDLILCGLLAYQLFENRDSIEMKDMENDIINNFFERMLKGDVQE